MADALKRLLDRIRELRIKYADECLYSFDDKRDVSDTIDQFWAEMRRLGARPPLPPVELGNYREEYIDPRQNERMNFRMLHEALNLAEDAVAAADDERQQGPWTNPDSPTRWAKVFGVSVDTIKQWFREQKIRNKKLGAKSYRVHVEELPKSD